MSLLTRAAGADDVLISLHPRRLGIVGDGLPGDTSALVLDGQVVATKRGKIIGGIAAGSNGAGAVTVAGAVVGDVVIMVTNLTTPGVASASFEATVSVAGQVQQTSASNLSGSTYQFLLDPRS
jgi:hypothetical protein